MKKTRFEWLEFIIGIVMVILGILTFIKPGNVLGGFTRIYAVIAIVSGIRNMIFYCRAERYTGFRPVISITACVFSLMAGVVLFVYPEAGVIILSCLIPIWFLSHSIFRLANLDCIRYLTGTYRYYFTLITSILGLILGVMMLFNPFASVITVSMIIGIYLIFTGITNIVLSFVKK